jgi:signal transduction histidine kinase
MARLYLRIYLAVLGSIALFALLAGLSWFLLRDYDRFGPRPDFYRVVAERVAPAADAAPEVQRKALEEWRRLSGFDVAILGPDGRVLADSGGDMLDRRDIASWIERGEGSRRRWRGPHWSEAVQLSDGRWLMATRPQHERAPLRRFGWLAALLGIAAAVGIAAYPVVRRLTRRLETLQVSVAALGSGDLSARVKVEGRDEIARLAQTFNRTADRIQSLVAANKSLLANASHELRSPLARLRMGIEGLASGAPSPAKTEELARNIRELDQLIEEILLASRLDGTGTTVMATEDIDLVALVAEECAMADAAFDIRSGGLPVVSGEPRLLRRLLRNLIENAARYSGGGPPEVSLDGPAGGRIVLDVADRGPGVPEAERTRIFEPFYRLAGASERSGGVGLGLALVRQIAERHGGTVACLPREGGGSVFRVMLAARLT